MPQVPRVAPLLVLGDGAKVLGGLVQDPKRVVALEVKVVRDGPRLDRGRRVVALAPDPAASRNTNGVSSTTLAEEG